MTKQRSRFDAKRIPLVSLALLLAVLVGLSVFCRPFRIWVGLEKPDGLTVHYIDVGQGDASLLLFDDGSAVMIDTGTVSSAERLTGYLRMHGVKELRYLILTHPHEDHIGGAADLLRSFPVETVVINAALGSGAVWDDFCSARRESGCRNVIADVGMTFPCGSGEIEVLGPRRLFDEENDNSLYLRVTYGDTAFLFTGDAGIAAELDLLFDGADLSCNVLKLGHHGSSSASSSALVQCAAPAYAIASCGRNNTYSHPDPTVLAILEDADVEVCRTDIMGDITFFSNGVTVTRQTYPY